MEGGSDLVGATGVNVMDEKGYGLINNNSASLPLKENVYRSG